jgi:protein ImuA
MIEELRQTLRALERPTGMEDMPDVLPLGVAAIDTVLGGGLARGALHEIAAAGEAHVAAAAGFAVGVAARGRLVWIAEDMALAESGAPYGPGLEAFGLAPERLLTVAVAHMRDLLWAMEEALRCRAVSAVIGELRHGEIDGVAVRRLSLAAAQSGALALLLRSSPPHDASTATTRWVVGAAPSASVILGRPPQLEGRRRTNPESTKPAATYGIRAQGLTPASRHDEEKAGGERTACFAVRLTRNRRGPLGAWMLQWSDDDERFLLATPAQPVAAPAADRPHRQNTSEAA